MGILTEPLNGVGEPGEFYVYVRFIPVAVKQLHRCSAR